MSHKTEKLTPWQEHYFKITLHIRNDGNTIYRKIKWMSQSKPAHIQLHANTTDDITN